MRLLLTTGSGWFVVFTLVVASLEDFLSSVRRFILIWKQKSTHQYLDT